MPWWLSENKLRSNVLMKLSIDIKFCLIVNIVTIPFYSHSNDEACSYHGLYNYIYVK